MEHQQELADHSGAVLREQWLTRHTIGHVLGVGAVGAAAALSAANLYLANTSADVEVAGTRVTVAPQHEPYATVDAGSFGLRIPLDVPLPLGAVVTVHEGVESPKKMGERLGSPDALLTASAELQDVVISQFKRAAGWGGAAGILAGAATPWVWRRREQIKQQARQASPRSVAAGAAAVALVGAFGGSLKDVQVEPSAWAPVKSFVPQEYQSYLDRLPPELVNAEVRGPVKLTGKGHEQIMKEVDKFIKKNISEPQEFVEQASQNVVALAAETPPKPEGVFRLAVISDMHDNTFMADVWGKAFTAYQVDGLIDAGDTTGLGNAVEDFSAQEIVKNSANVPYRAYIRGNHDKPAALTPYDDAEFTHLEDGKPVQVGPLLAVGDDSNTYTPLNGPNETLQSFDEASDTLRDNSCNSDTAANILITHQPWLADKAIDDGCAQVSVAGHMHTPGAPVYHQNEDGTAVYSVQNGTSGGAEQFITIGKPKKPAGITMIDYSRDEQGDWYPVIVRQVSIDTHGKASSDDTKLEPTVTFQDVRAAIRAAEADLAPQAMR